MREPDLVGPAGKAWRIPSKTPAQVVNYIVHAPGQYPLWEWWLMTAVSLKPFPKLPAPVKRFPTAEYEVLFVTLEASDPTDGIDPDDEGSLHFLMPIDVVQQYGGLDDQMMKDLVNLAVQSVIQGKMPAPDSDKPKMWLATLDNTVEHLLSGRHTTPAQA